MNKHPNPAMRRRHCHQVVAALRVPAVCVLCLAALPQAGQPGLQLCQAFSLLASVQLDPLHVPPASAASTAASGVWRNTLVGSTRCFTCWRGWE